MSGSIRLATHDFSQAIGTVAVQIWTQPPLPGTVINYMRIYNVSPSATIWCSRSGTAAANTAGSFPISPGQYELWVAPGPIPLNALSVVATASATPVTIEVG